MFSSYLRLQPNCRASISHKGQQKSAKSFDFRHFLEPLARFEPAARSISMEPYDLGLK